MFYLFLLVMIAGGAVLGFAIEGVLRDRSQVAPRGNPLLDDLKRSGLKAFRLADHAPSRGVTVADLHNEAVVAFRVYCEKAVADGEVSDKELKALSSLAGALGLSDSLAATMLAAVKRTKLADQATEALGDNTVTAEEQREIDTLRDRLGLTGDEGRAAMYQAFGETSKRRKRRFQFTAGGSIACGVLAAMLAQRSASSEPAKPVAKTASVAAPSSQAPVPPAPITQATGEPDSVRALAPAPQPVAITPVPSVPTTTPSQDPCAPVIVGTFTGKVISIADGDTLTVRTDGESIKVRLQGIDTPEDGQSFGTKAKQALSALVGGKQVAVKKTGVDKYGRTLAFVEVDGTEVSERMVLDGWAWHYTEYNCEARLAIAERMAREGHRGLWDDPNPLPPWEYRARRENAAVARQSSPAPTRAPQRVAEPVKEAPKPVGKFWLNTSSGVRHNAGCQHYANTKRGRACGPNEGKACGICGG